MNAAAVAAAHVGYHPAITPRLVVPQAQNGPLDLSAERTLGSYGPVVCNDVIGELKAALLRGRGGAGFPAHVKWRAVADGAEPCPRVVVANGEEGEPASAKDRWLLTHRPHAVLDGLLLAAAVTGADRAVVYLSHPETVGTVEKAIAELRTASLVPAGLRLDVHVVAPTYVAGEESAVCRSINGGPALPLAKPPRPFESGVSGLPTLVSNVETLAHAAWIARHGAAEYRRHGTAGSPGTTLVTLSGACEHPGVYEVPYGLSVRELFTGPGGGFTSPPSGFLMGGWFGGLLSAERAEVACCFDAVRAVGSGLGCGAVTALGADEDPLAIAADIAAWYAAESAQQCGVCLKGTAAIRDAVATLRDRNATSATAANLTRWGATLPRRGACAFLDGAATLARSLAAEFPAAVAAGVVAPPAESAEPAPSHSNRHSSKETTR